MANPNIQALKARVQALNAQSVTTYEEFRVLLSRFAAGLNPLVVVVGAPGLGKSESIREAVGDKAPLILKGHVTPLGFYQECWFASSDDRPIILDDVHAMMENREVRGLVTQLAETTEERLMMWTSSKNIDVPPQFRISSPVCVITNEWKPRDTILNAIASRAGSKFVRFEPNWAEAYRFVSKWFWNQEIADYVHSLLPFLKPPDVRIFVDAWRDMRDEHHLWPWKRAIHNHIDDNLFNPVLLEVAKLLADQSYPSHAARSRAFSKSERTFYRQMKKVERHQASVQVERLKMLGAAPS